MIRLSRLADYGVVLATHMAGQPERSFNAADLAEMTHVPAPTVSKLLATLTRGNLLHSHRGVKGGYRLSRPAKDISLADIVAAIDGPIALTLCVEIGGSCEVEAFCPSRKGWRLVNQRIQDALASVSLADLLPVDAPHKEIDRVVIPAGSRLEAALPTHRSAR